MRIQEAIMNINFGLHSQRKGGFKFMRYQPHIEDVTLPTRLGLRPVALRLPLFTSAILHLLSVNLSHFQPNTDTGHLVLFQDCGSILLAVGWLDYIVITSYVSQLVNHLCTRTPMGDLVEQSRLALDSHCAYSI